MPVSTTPPSPLTHERTVLPLTPETVVAMSGGVDSSVAALLTVQSGVSAGGLFMKNWDDDAEPGHCPWEDDVADVLAVAESLGLAVNTIDLTREYWDRVFADFLAEYQRGRTPNPDILCNREIKFRAFLDAAKALGASKIATGHYARTDCVDGRHRLLRGVDTGKDQSYFLYTLGQAQLAHTVFPIGHLPKAAVRDMARAAALAVADKKDSTGICFIGERHFRSFLSSYLPAQPGDIRTLDDRVVGTHPGALYYTLGQRQGLSIGGVRGAEEAPWFVAAKDVQANVLYVVQGHDHPALMSRTLVADTLSWVAGAPPEAPFLCTAKTRYRQPDQPCTVTAINEGEMRVIFDAPQRAVTPGQSIVLYRGEECLGGGIIAEADAPHLVP